MTEQVMEWIKQEALIAPGDCVVAGISGGADSVCLLLILLELQKTITFDLCAVHVEHGIRGEESREDAAFVEALCGRHAVPCRVYALDVPAYAKSHGLGMEEAARMQRYECYGEEVSRLREKAGSVKVALAHHADDNAETLLFRMARGSGIRGLAGMRPKRPFVEGAEIIRPLLSVLRQDIEQYLNQAGQEYRTDSSNLDLSYSRNRIRHQVLPQLTRVNAQAVSHINQSARLLGQMADYLREQGGALAAECCRWEGAGDCFLNAEALEGCPKLLQSEVVYRVLEAVSGSGRDIGAVHVAAVEELFSRQVGRSVDLPYGVRARRVYGGVQLRKTAGVLPEQPLATDDREYRVERRRLELGEQVSLKLYGCEMRFRLLDFSGDSGQICKKKYTKWLNYDKIKDDLQVRKPKAGDYLTIDLQGHQKKLKEYFVNEKIPLEKRDETWLLTEGSHVVWVVGGRISSAYNIHEHTRKILEVQIVGGIAYEDERDSCLSAGGGNRGKSKRTGAAD